MAKNNKKVYVILIVVLLLVAISGLTAYHYVVPKKETAINADTLPKEDTTTAIPKISAVGLIGTTFTYENMYTVTVLRLDSNVSITNILPDEGNRFVAVEIEFKSIDTRGSAIAFQLTHTEIMCDGESYSFAKFPKQPELAFFEPVKRGKSIKGWLTFEIPIVQSDPLFLHLPNDVYVKLANK